MNLICRLEKINVTINMSSIMGGLRQNLSIASSVTACTEILAHNEERNFGAWCGEQKFWCITTRHCLDWIHSTSYCSRNSMDTKCMWSQADQCWQLIISSTAAIKSWPINCAHQYTYLVLCLSKQYNMGIKEKKFMAWNISCSSISPFA